MHRFMAHLLAFAAIPLILDAGAQPGVQWFNAITAGLLLGAALAYAYECGANS